MNSFVQALQGVNQYSLTENGATALNTTGSKLVDLFGTIGALRSRSEQEVVDAFAQAFAEDKLLATKLSFYARNVRGGLGERDVPRTIWKHLAMTQPEVMAKNLEFVPLFGRWDDILIFEGTPLEDAMYDLIVAQLRLDAERANKGESISLAAKWLPRTDVSNRERAKIGRKIARRLKISHPAFNKNLSRLRAYLEVVEVKMSQNRWEDIVYSAVPSRAMMIYRKAFQRHDAERFEAFLNALTRGEEKVNASTLYPYDILERMGLQTTYRGHLDVTHYDSLLEEQWKSLLNYVSGDGNVLVMADTSASMTGRPMNTAVGLAIYFAERNRGVFKDMFMTFSSRPSLVKLQGATLADKVRSIPSIVENTDLELAFELVLHTAVENNVPAEDMPKSIVVISDMEINQARGANSRYETFHAMMKRRFAEAGYEIPNIVYWNVDSRRDTFHAKADMPGVQIASGQSVSVFKSVLANIGKSAYEAMVATLSDPVYDCITV